MKKLFKILLSIIIVLVIVLVIIVFPFPESPSWKVDKSILLEYHRSGGLAGFTDTIKIFTNGSVEFDNGREVFSTKLSNEDLQKLSQFIDSKEYSLKTKSLLAERTEPTCCDLMYTSYLINENGKTLIISHDKIMSDIIQSIDKKARSELYNITE